jgi:hypothetical protein
MHSSFQSNLALPDAEVVYHDVCGVDVPVPALTRGWLHGRLHVGPWAVGRMVEQMKQGLWLSFYGPDADAPELDTGLRPTVLAGLWPAGGFIELTLVNNTEMDEVPRYQLRLFAPTAALAETLLDHLKAEFLPKVLPAATGPRIALLNASYTSIELHRVVITPEQQVPREVIDVFYDTGASDWLKGWIARLQERRYGLSILSGDPGTGKTTLLRSLASWLSDSHLFYFMPASKFSHVDAGEIVAFWANENRQSKLRKILVLEDAESVLLRRGADNREHVANLLNLTDGIMGDALGLQVVCTLNSDLTDIDPALLRPGRLITHREFLRLRGPAAQRLAAHLGKPLPATDSVSLAELYNPIEETAPQPGRVQRPLGFHAALGKGT